MSVLPLIVFCLMGATPAAAESPLAPPPAGRELICRGCEESGNITEDQPMWPCHLVSLFVTGKNPDSPIHTIQQHVDWVCDPAHSYVDDGTGALAVWAHPRDGDAEPMVALKGLVGMEVSHGGDSARRERLWDEVLTRRHDQGRAYLWGFAADDTHSSQPDRIGLSFLAARMDRFSERALKGALRAGAFYASNGPLLSDIRVADGTVTIDLPSPCEVRWLKSGQFGAGPAEVTPGVGENHCLRCQRGVRTGSYTPNEKDGTTDPKAARFVRALIIDSKGRIAHTMPFRILGPKKLANPYPPTGRWYRGQTHNHCDATGLKRRPVIEYRRAYHRIGHHWTFATDYGYWLTPFQRSPDLLVRVDGVSPDRGRRGQATRLRIFGRLFHGKCRVSVGGRAATDVKWLYENRLEATVPADLPVGVHDVTVADGDGFKDTLPAAYTVQAPDADSNGWATWTTLNSRLPGDRTFCTAFAKGNVVWVGTQFGAGRFDGRRWRAVTRSNNTFIGDAILSIAADRKGNTWFGSFRGLARLSPGGQWDLFRTEQGLPSREVNRVFIDSKDDVWITYNGRSSRLSHFDGRRWEHLTPPNAKGQRMSLAIAEDSAGRMLVSPRNSGVGVYDKGRWEVWNTGSCPLPDNFVRHIRRGRGGSLYFATTSVGREPTGGLAILRDGKWTVHEQGKPARWMLDDGKWVFFPQTGLASYRVWDLCADRGGNVWCATSRGVSRLAPDGTWKTFTTRNSGLAFDFVMGVAQAPDGAIWFTTARGVSRYQPAE